MTEFKEGDLVRVAARHLSSILPGTEWHWQTGLVVEIEPQRRYPAVVTALFAGRLVQRSAVLFERVQDG